MKKFEPMLAAREPGRILFPVYASPKYDGVRAVVMNGVVLSRNLKPIPNRYVQSLFSKAEHLDGELILGEPTAKDVFRKTTSAVMSADGEPNVHFYVFDSFEQPNAPFTTRIKSIKPGGPIKLVPQILIESQEDLDFLENTLVLEEGYEGLMVRQPYGLYKYGRSTSREGYLAKIKRFDQSIGKVIDFEVLFRNENPKQVDEKGRAKRSSHVQNMVASNLLGSLIVQDEEWGTVKLGSGFTENQRAEIWENQKAYLGKLVRYKYFPVGIKDKPRHPIFLEFI